MKRLAIVLGTMMVIAAIAYPVFARGPGWGPGWSSGHHMWGAGPGYCWNYRSGGDDLTNEQRTKLSELDKKFFEETNSLRNDLWSKRAELDTLLSGPNPDAGKAKALQTDISELRNKLAEKRLSYDLEARKVAPETGFSGGYGPGYGHHMGGFGPGWRGHGPGYGPGYCWN